MWDKVDPFEKIDIESQLAIFSNAGCITYTEIDADAQKNTEALEELVNYAMDKDLPYFAVNVPSDSCTECRLSRTYRWQLSTVWKLKYPET